MVPILVATVVALALLVASLHEARRSMRPSSAMARGNWAEARTAAEVVERSWMRVLPGVREGAVYVRALCLHIEGHFDESLSLLSGMKSPPARLLPAVKLLVGGNLVLLDREPARAANALAIACTMHSLPEDLLLFALAKHAQGKREEAEELFRRAGRERPPKAPWPEVNEAVFRFLRGTYLGRTGRGAEGKKELERAAAAETWTFYVARARQLTASSAAAESKEDPPSSLAALIIDR